MTAEDRWGFPAKPIPSFRRVPLLDAPLGSEEFEPSNSVFQRGDYVQICRPRCVYHNRIGQILRVRGRTNKPVLYVFGSVDNLPRVVIDNLLTHELRVVRITPLELLAMQAPEDVE